MTIVNYLDELQKNTFSYHYSYQFSEFVLFVLFGSALGFEHWINEIKKPGKWVINKSKIIFLCLPILLFSLITPFKALSPFLLNEAFSIVPAIVLGYSFITSFKKKQLQSIASVSK
jgi:hypothetical protein